jgi:hypothetical protein
VRDRDLVDHGAERRKPIDRGADRGGDGGLDALAERLPDDPDAEARDSVVEPGGVLGHRGVERRRVAWIVPGEHLQQRGRVPDAP